MTVSSSPAHDAIAALRDAKGDLTEEHWQQITELQAEIERLKAEIAARKKALTLQESRSHRQKRHPGVIGRNDPCPCASGKKFKTCCMKKQ